MLKHCVLEMVAVAITCLLAGVGSAVALFAFVALLGIH